MQGISIPMTGPIGQMGGSMMQGQGMGTSNMTTPQYDNGGGFHAAMPKVDFFGDMANPYHAAAGRPQGSGTGQGGSDVPVTRMAGVATLSPHIDNESAFSMMNDLGSRVDYGDSHLPSRRLSDRGQRLATFNSGEQTGAHALENNATTLSRAGPIAGAGPGINLGF